MSEIKKEYVLISQGVEIYRTDNKSEAEEIMINSNEDWYEYCQRCYDNYEIPADNEIFMEEIETMF